MDMIAWTLMAKLRDGDFFFSRNVYSSKGVCSDLKLQTSDISSRMKAVAAAEGVDTKYISAKSLRKGMASSLAKTGIDSEEINEIGRWAPGSRASRRYVHSASTTGALSGRGRMVSTKDISRMRQR